MSPIFFALVSYFSWGVGDVIGTITARKLGAFSVMLWSTIISLILMTFYAPFAADELVGLTPFVLGANIAIAAVWLVGWFAFSKALIIGNPSLVGTIASSFSAVAALISIVFLKEVLSWQQSGAIIIIFLGILLATLTKEVFKHKKLIEKGTSFALLSMVCFGVAAAFQKIPVSLIGWFWPQYITFLVFLSLLFLLRAVRHVKIQKPTFKHVLGLLIIQNIILRTGEFTYNAAISKGLVAIVAPIAGSYITLFVPLAFFVFREPITKQQIGGIIITVIGIVCLSVISV